MELKDVIMGSKVKDTITGVRGVVTGKLETLAGAHQVLIEYADGVNLKQEYLYVSRIETVGE